MSLWWVPWLMWTAYQTCKPHSDATHYVAQALAWSALLLVQRSVAKRGVTL